ncbi:MAG: hypothetical protein ACPHL6_09785, partial [Rubripirellula sp.]
MSSIESPQSAEMVQDPVASQSAKPAGEGDGRGGVHATWRREYEKQRAQGASDADARALVT